MTYSPAPDAAEDLLDHNRYTAIISAPFAIDQVTLISMKGTERMGEPFSYDVKLLSFRRIQNFSTVVGGSMTVGLKLDDGSTRYFNGIIKTFSYLGSEDTRRSLYVATIVPWLSLLDYRRNARTFQNLTSLEIVKTIFGEHSAATFQDLTRAAPPKRPFCVQYDETDFNFVSRLLEQDGIYYFFLHRQKEHTLILADSTEAHKPCAPGTIMTNPGNAASRFHDDIFWQWNETVSLQAGQIVMKDYDHEKPSADLMAVAPVPAVGTGGVPTLNEDRAFDGLGGGNSGERTAVTDPGDDASQREVFLFPGRFTEKAVGDTYARIRAEEQGAAAYRVRITGSARQLCSGNTFRAANPFEITDLNLMPDPTTSFLALGCEIDIVGETGEMSDTPGRAFLFQCTVEAQLAETQYRPPLRAVRPVIAGPQTAVTVGRPGETITTDALGRIKVKFFWDRSNVRDENSSCWIRVSQNWAGKTFGGLVTPRVGQEVVVAFIGGNPDWPIVTGAVYNAQNNPPETLPLHATRSTFKTRSDRGTAVEFNELRFEDQRGAEEVYLKAQRDYNVQVGGDYSIDVARQYSMTLPVIPLNPVDPVPLPMALGSRITVTPEKISFVVTGPTGKQAVEITEEGVFIVGSAIGLLATGPLSITPPPSPAPSALMLEAALALEIGLPDP